jgi:hypothetical protein
MVCSIENVTNRAFRYKLYIQKNGGYLLLLNDVIDYKKRGIDFGVNGILVSFLLVTTLTLVGVHNAQISLLMSLLGIFVGFVIGYMPLSVASLIAIIILILIILLKGDRFGA